MFVCIEDINPSENIYKLNISNEKKSNCVCIPFKYEPKVEDISNMFSDYYVNLYGDIKYNLKDLTEFLFNYNEFLINKNKSTYYNPNHATNEVKPYIHIYTPRNFANKIIEEIESIIKDSVYGLEDDYIAELNNIIKHYSIFLVSNVKENIKKRLKYKTILQTYANKYNHYGTLVVDTEDELKMFFDCNRDVQEANLKIILYILEHFKEENFFRTDEFDRYEDSLFKPLYKKYGNIGLSDTGSRDHVAIESNDIIRELRPILNQIDELL